MKVVSFDFAIGTLAILASFCTVSAETTYSTSLETASRPHAILQDTRALKTNSRVPFVSTESGLKNSSDDEKAFILSQALKSQGGGDSGFFNQHKDAVAGALILTMIERAINKLFVSKAIKFPAQLAGCIALFFSLILADVVSPGLGESLYKGLLPGSTLLAKWFPVLFVPGLVLLPLAPSIGSGMEVVKFLGVAVIGFIYSLATTAYAVLFLRGAQGSLVTAPPAPIKAPKKSASPATRAKPYRDETMLFLTKATIVTGLASILATRCTNWNDSVTTPLRTIFFFFTTFATFVWGARLPPSITKVVHPLIISTILTLGVIQGTSTATGSGFVEVLKTYKVGSLELTKMGAADIMVFLLGPSVVSFAISMYDRRQLLKENLPIVAVSMLVSSVGGLFGTAKFVQLIKLGGAAENALMVRLSTVARNVTTALAMACTAILEGDVSLAVLIVVITGVLGATYGRTILDAIGIHDPVTRGLAVGGAAQGLGVTSMMSEADAYPFAAMSMILTAISATIMVSVPAIKQILVDLCQG